ncbi:hypothetical protein ATORI0001_1269 [Lancefieldella rimae ATCC 49626]|uniref:Uncharacterized protein n=1 Tax=Lancefieldella rimae (strain ATCC 49626 / DSM 7090 / CCUG 31168 / NBRC 15546 / VPI D140H-11A) TaxID=553184 RepID=B9CLT6_LANR4|nr:hypothetical protein ATORI0001_1269 [Lancefieldella rimae ATCC 49626]
MLTSANSPRAIRTTLIFLHEVFCAYVRVISEQTHTIPMFSRYFTWK